MRSLNFNNFNDANKMASKLRKAFAGQLRTETSVTLLDELERFLRGSLDEPVVEVGAPVRDITFQADVTTMAAQLIALRDAAPHAFGAYMDSAMYPHLKLKKQTFTGLSEVDSLTPAFQDPALDGHKGDGRGSERKVAAPLDDSDFDFSVLSPTTAAAQALMSRLAAQMAPADLAKLADALAATGRRLRDEHPMAVGASTPGRSLKNPFALAAHH